MPFKIKKVDENDPVLSLHKVHVDVGGSEQASIPEPRPKHSNAEPKPPAPRETSIREIDVIPLPQPGKVYTGEIVKIYSGTLGDFLGDYVDEDRADIPAYKLVIKIPEIGLTKSVVLTQCLSQKCALGRILSCYREEVQRLGGIRKGMRLLVEYTEDAKIRIMCPDEVEAEQ